MRKRLRYSCDVVAEVNGFQIERERIGAATYWNAIRLDAEGFWVKGFSDCASKADAIAKAEAWRA
jgi:hypothetical protein